MTTWMCRQNNRALTVFSLCLALLGCGDDAKNSKTGNASEGPRYVIANEVYTSDESTSYVNVLRSLDVQELDYSKAIEFSGGRATIATYDGSLFVAGPETRMIERFSLGDDGALLKTGEVSFLNYGLNSVTIDDWGNSFISPTKAYLFNSAEGKTIVWNPSTMEIVGEVEQSSFDLVREVGDINGSSGVVRGNRLYRTIFWSDWDSWKTSDEQYLAVYDTENDKLIELVPEQRCPGLGNRVDQDEQGNLYFSNWIWNVPETLLNAAPKSCALRISAGSDHFDADWTLPYAATTEGREAAMFAYLGNGKALISVFHDERAQVVADTIPSELASTANWRVWNMDLEARTGAPLEGLDWMAGAASTFHIDDRSFMLVPGANWEVTHVHEIKDGRATLIFDVTGWSYQLFKLR